MHGTYACMHNNSSVLYSTMYRSRLDNVITCNYNVLLSVGCAVKLQLKKY